MGTSVDIQFDKESKVYMAGETVTGKVVVQSNDEKSLRLIKGLRVRCKGIASVDIKIVGETVIPFVDEDARLYTEKLVKTVTPKSKDTEIVRYEYPFQFPLGKDLPPSFKTPYGKMEYFLKATLPSGCALSYFEGKGAFTVVGLLDLNTKKSLRHSLELHQEANMTTLLHGVSGVVVFILRIPHKAYAVGEKILMTQEIDNRSKQHVKANISLIQKITYEIMGHVRLDKENKMKILGKEVPPETKDVSTDQTFDVPEVPITSEIRLKAERKTIKINYFLKYELTSRPGWTNKMKGYVPITIGSIGFRKQSTESLHKVSPQ